MHGIGVGQDTRTPDALFESPESGRPDLVVIREHSLLSGLAWDGPAACDSRALLSPLGQSLVCRAQQDKLTGWRQRPSPVLSSPFSPNKQHPRTASLGTASAACAGVPGYFGGNLARVGAVFRDLCLPQLPSSPPSDFPCKWRCCARCREPQSTARVPVPSRDDRTACLCVDLAWVENENSFSSFNLLPASSAESLPGVCGSEPHSGL